MSAPILTDEMPLLYSNVKTKIDPVTGLKSSLTVGGFLYQKKLSLGSNEQSLAILIPQGDVIDIELCADHTPTLYGTLSSEADIKANSAIWFAISVSGITNIPLACTAFYVIGNATASIVIINARYIGG